MAFRTFKTSRPVTSLEAFGRDLAHRRDAMEQCADVPRNKGNRRTDGKRALLAEIEIRGGKW